MSNSRNRPTIGLALSGGSGRAIAHIGVLEVLHEYQIPVDIITACSSGTIVAGSYASGTMNALKNDWLTWDKKFMFELFEVDDSGRGLFSTDKIAEKFSQYLTCKKFEKAEPRLGFVTVDVLSGEPVVLALGDIIKAGQASCAVPGLFEPVEWGNKLLVDGGLVSLVPVEQARQMGAEVVIGVDIAASKHMYKKRYLRAWKGLNLIRKNFLYRLLSRLVTFFDRVYESSIKVIFYTQSDFYETDLVKDNLDFFAILGKALDIADRNHKEDSLPIAEVMLQPKVKHLGKMDFHSAKQMYLEGRRVALEAIPEIEKTLKNYHKSHDT